MVQMVTQCARAGEVGRLLAWEADRVAVRLNRLRREAEDLRGSKTEYVAILCVVVYTMRRVSSSSEFNGRASVRR